MKTERKMVMQAFERKVGELFDFNHFEPHPEMEKLIEGFEKSYLSGEKENGKREPISFKELEGDETTKTSHGITAPTKESKTEKDKGKQR